MRKLSTKNIGKENIDKLNKLCNKYKVSKLYLFGSARSKNFNKNSDLDFIVTFKDIDKDDYFDNYYDFKFSLIDALNRKIDLLEEKAIRNPFLKISIDNSKEKIYG